MLVPSLRDELAVPVPADRRPGRSLAGRPPPLADEAAAVRSENGGPIRIGYARCSMHTQELAGQLDLLERAGCRRVFSEKISTRVRVRPELENALALAREIKQPPPTRPSSSPWRR